MTGAPDEAPGGRGSDLAVMGFGAVVAVLGLLMLLEPSLVAARFSLDVDQRSLLLTLRAAGPALLAMGAAAWLSCARGSVRDRVFPVALVVLVVAGYLSLTTCLRGWIVDDAAITFAYSKNLATGHGIVIKPGHVPEEGYSNTSWMLLLAGARRVGVDIAVTAKRAGIAFGALAIALCLYVCLRLTGHRARFGLLALGATICVGAPFVIWSASGLEHAAQAAMVAVVIAAPLWPRFERALMAGALSALVLTRPEAPLVVAFVTAVVLLRDRSRVAMRAAVARYWPIVVLPGLTWVALNVFRLTYFHELLSNPYYAKATEASWFRVANFVGVGWTYVFKWLADAHTWLLVPLVLIVPWRAAPLPYQLAVAACLAQLAFCLFAGGDWMGCHRFISPVLPAVAVVVVYGLHDADRRRPRLASDGVCLALVWLLGLGTVSELAAFLEHPTTPAGIVAEIGNTFVDLGHRLGIQNPSLAHHDAGGTTYESDIDLVDLGGLADREVAKHIHDREFMRRYIFEQRRPTFIFGGSRVFAARYTQFFKMPEFAAGYIPLRFSNRPNMDADLCHVRRDAIHAAPGIRYVKDGATEYWEVE